MSNRERIMLIVLGVVVVLGAGIFFLTRGGGEPEEAAPTPPAPPPVAPPAEETPKPPRIPVFFAARDPFVPLVVEPTVTSTVSPDGDGVTDGDGTQPPPEGQPPVEEPNGDGQQPGVSVGGRNVVVIDVFTSSGEEVVQVTIDGESFTVGEGDRFAGSFQVVSIEGECATFLFGDEQFTACEGGRPK